MTATLVKQLGRNLRCPQKVRRNRTKYDYDGLDRLKDYQRGTLAGTYPGFTGIANTADSEEDFGYDQVGNWASYTVKAGGNTTLAQTRTHNVANEIASDPAGNAINQGTGQTAWSEPAYDLAGNMTSMPAPLSLTSSVSLVYDAWNRLVKVGDDWEYQYDGLNRRIVKLRPTTDPDDNPAYNREDYYYNESWQMTDEWKEDFSPNKTTLATMQKRWWMWSARYIDMPVMSKDNGSTYVYFTTDANMNVTGQVSDSDAVTERYVYDAYGAVTFLTAGWAANGSPSHKEVLYCG